jgi:hypothetical protein
MLAFWEINYGRLIMLITEKQKELFWSRIDKEKSEFFDCWEWTGRVNGKGYGEIDFHQFSHSYSHRIAWILTNGEIPDGLCVLHECDNPPCCNPDHLYLGTNKDNVDDKMRKGRHRCGQDAGTSKLVNEEVLEIRRLYNEDGMRISCIARKYRRGYNTIRYIVNGVHWKHLL